MGANKKNLSKETAAAISYVLGPITGVLFLIIDEDKFVRFHAMQSIVFSFTVMIINTILTFTVILGPLVPLMSIVEFILWLMLIYTASQGKKIELPVISKFSSKLIS